MPNYAQSAWKIICFYCFFFLLLSTLLQIAFYEYVRPMTLFYIITLWGFWIVYFSLTFPTPRCKNNYIFQFSEGSNIICTYVITLRSEVYFKSCNFIWWTYCYSKMASNFVHSIFLTFDTPNNQMWSTYLGVLFLLPLCPIKEMGGFEFLKIQNHWM